MTHYLSEMNDEQRQNHESRTETRRRIMAAKIKKDIEVQGIEHVLALILDEPTIARIRYMP